MCIFFRHINTFLSCTDSDTFSSSLFNMRVKVIAILIFSEISILWFLGLGFSMHKICLKKSRVFFYSGTKKFWHLADNHREDLTKIANIMSSCKAHSNWILLYIHIKGWYNSFDAQTWRNYWTSGWDCDIRCRGILKWF